MLVGCVQALEDECASSTDCDTQQLCIGGVCVSPLEDDARPGDASTPEDVGATPGDIQVPDEDGGVAPDQGVGPLECPPGFGDADREPGNGCEHGCVVPGPRGELVSETDAPHTGADLTIAVDPDAADVLIAWTSETTEKLHVWNDGATRPLGPDDARFDRQVALRFEGGWAVAARPIGVIGEPTLAGFRISEEGAFSLRILTIDPDPPAIARLGVPGGETAPAMFFLDERNVRGTGQWTLKVAAIASVAAGGAPIRPRGIHAFPDATRTRIAAASTDRGVVVVLAEHDADGADFVRVVLVDPGGAFVESAAVPVDAPIEELGAVHTPNGVLVGAIGGGRFYIGRVKYADGPEPRDFGEVDLGGETVSDLRMLSLPRGDAAMVVVNKAYAAMILLDEVGAVAWADPLVGPRTDVVGAVGAAGANGTAVSWIREEDGERQLLWARVDCQ